MLWMVDAHDNRPLFEQVADCVRVALHNGSLKTGEKLPPAKELAASLEINVHTVLKAYQTLRDERILELRQGRGAVVTGSKNARIDWLIKELALEAKRAGISLKEITAQLEKEEK